MRNANNADLPRFETGKQAGEVMPYSWPGHYPIRYITKDGGCLCAACVNGGNGSRADEELDEASPDDAQWIVIGADLIEETDEEIRCDHCNTILAFGPGEDEKAFLRLSPEQRARIAAETIRENRELGDLGES